VQTAGFFYANLVPSKKLPIFIFARELHFKAKLALLFRRFLITVPSPDYCLNAKASKMKIHFCYTLTFILTLNFIFSQAPKEKAATNFELYFYSIKSDDPGTKTSFNDYSDLWARKSIPEELKIMLEYDTTKFYNSYMYQTKYLRDTLIKISTLNLNQDVKDVYSKFRRSILDGEKQGKFHYKEDNAYSEKLKIIINQTNPPKIGYYQTAVMLAQFPNGKKEENKILITYNNDLEPIDFVIIEK
jgi:hypothetical protein